MYSLPTLHLFLDKKDRKFFIQNYIEHPEFGYSVATGDFINVHENELEKTGLDIICKHLKDYTDRKTMEKSPFEKMGESEAKEFYANYVSVSFVQLSPKQLSLCFMEFDQNGSSIGKPEDEVYLDLPCDNKKFYDTVIKILNLA